MNCEPVCGDIMNSGNANVETNRFQGELQSFVGFVKEYIGFLTAVVSLPILTGIADIIPAPADDNKRITLLSGFVCAIMFGVWFLLKNALLDMLSSKRMRLVPFVLGITFVLGAAYVTVSYFEFPAKERPVWVYLWIHPLYVSALAIVAIASYGQMSGRSLEAEIDTKINNIEQIAHLKSIIRSYADYYVNSIENKSFDLSKAILSGFEAQLRELAKGEISVRGPEINVIQFALFDKCRQSFFAVSDRDLDFWVSEVRTERDILDNLLGEEYFKLNISAQRRNIKVSRIFIIDDPDLAQRSNVIEEVIQSHENEEFGWAIALAGELPPDLGPDGRDLDFALFDCDGLDAAEAQNRAKAVSFFTNYRDSKRGLRVVFPTAGNAEIISKQIALHTKLSNHCWFVNPKFVEIHQIKTSEQTFKEYLNHLETNERWRPKRPIVVSQPGDIARMVRALSKMRKKSRSMFLVPSTRAKALQGTWRYFVQFDTGGHGGVCSFEFDGTLRINGIRKITLENGVVTTQGDSTWQTEYVDLNSENQLVFVYEINVDHEKMDGYCNCELQVNSSTVDRIEGFIFLRRSKGDTLQGRICFERPEAKETDGEMLARLKESILRRTTNVITPEIAPAPAPAETQVA